MRCKRAGVMVAVDDAYALVPSAQSGLSSRPSKKGGRYPCRLLALSTKRSHDQGVKHYKEGLSCLCFQLLDD